MGLSRHGRDSKNGLPGRRREKKSSVREDRAGDHSRRPHLVIPCQVAPQQSLTPFLRTGTRYSIRSSCSNSHWTPELCLQNPRNRAGNHPAGEPADAHKLTSSPQFVSMPASAPNGLAAVTGYQLASTSPAKGTGQVITRNGGIDYFNRAVSATAAPSRGFHEALTVSGPRTYIDEGSSTAWLGISARSLVAV